MTKANTTGTTKPRARATKAVTKTAKKTARMVSSEAGPLPAAKAAPSKSPASERTASKQVVKAVSMDKLAAVAEAKEKVRKPKLVRDSFTMPETEYAALGEMKKACLKAGVEIKKSELLRIGVALLRQLDPAGIREIRAGLPTLKAGRPKKGK